MFTYSLKNRSSALQRQTQ